MDMGEGVRLCSTWAKNREGDFTFWKASSSSSLSKACGWSSADSTITRLLFRGELSSLLSGGSSGSCTTGEPPRSLDVGVWRYSLSSSGGVTISSGVLAGEPDVPAAFWASDISVPGVVTLKWKSPVYHENTDISAPVEETEDEICLHSLWKSKYAF